MSIQKTTASIDKYRKSRSVSAGVGQVVDGRA
jgi:hypothetical protein